LTGESENDYNYSNQMTFEEQDLQEQINELI
jgi:hypothetical protein